MADDKSDGLRRQFGLGQAVALNVTMIVGAGVFVTIVPMVKLLPGPYALLAWLGAGAVMLVDGLIWSELATLLPGSGGTYVYLLEGYGRHRWGRLLSFLFIWQFLLSGPLEIASGLVALAGFAVQLDPSLGELNTTWLQVKLWPEQDLKLTFDPSRLGAILVGVLLIALLYRRVTVLARLTVTFWVGVLAVIAWILIQGALKFRPEVAFDWPTGDALPSDFGWNLGRAMVLAMYSYLGYYSICYVGDEVRNPGRTLPRAVLGSAFLVMVLFAGLHLAMLGTISWRDLGDKSDDYLAPAFMEAVAGPNAARVVTALLVWTCLGSAFAGLLSYSRIPYGAARYGHFFALFRRVHPEHRIPHVSLLLVGGLVLPWCFFDLQNVINALIITRIVEQFVAQIGAVVLLRQSRPLDERPFRLWCYPIPCGLALIGWLYLYVTSDPVYIGLGAGTLFVGVGVFLVWSRRRGTWPFDRVKERPESLA